MIETAAIETAMTEAAMTTTEAAMTTTETAAIEASAIERLAAILQAVRGIGRLITSEADEDRLLGEACRLLSGTRGFDDVWICRLREALPAGGELSGRGASFFLTGFRGDFSPLVERWRAGGAPRCAELALRSPEVHRIDPHGECHGCPLAATETYKAALAVCLEHEGRTFGWMTASMPEAYATDEEQKELFAEAGRELAFALWSRETEGRRRRLEDEHAARKIEHEQILKAAIDGVWVLDPRGKLLEVNPAAAGMLGYTQEEMVHLTIDDVDALENPEEIRERIRKLRREGGGCFETRHRRKDGSLLDVEVSVSYVPHDSGHFVVFVRDVSTQKNLREQLQQAQKMESVGRLAGGVAHDFNNMLAVMIGHAELGLLQLEEEHPVHENLREILSSAERSASLTRQLLAFARKQTVSPRILSLNEIVERMLSILRRLIGENIELTFEPGRELWPVRIDPGQVDQVLANLTVNARDAVDGAGAIVLETRNVHVRENTWAGHLALLFGEYVQLSVRDDGCGMDQETRTHLFEPFFTTKEVEEGTGLGLSTVYGIVRQNEGVIDFDSEPGHGTTFRIFLPRYRGETESLPPTAPSKADVRGHETVLLVEDERAILTAGQRMLEKLGYRVLAAVTPKEALALAESRPDDIDLLVTDVVMPGMNGRELSIELRKLRPGLKVVFISGYSADLIADQGMLTPDVHFLQKPFSLKKLAGEVRRALESG